jgi:hypothetical protein
MPSYRRPWEQRMAETVGDFLSRGYSFNFAWRQAISRHKPTARDCQRIPPWGELDLFSAPVEEELSVVEATRQFFEDAFLGEKPGLAYFTLDVLRGDVDERSSVAHMSDFRLAA